MTRFQSVALFIFYLAIFSANAEDYESVEVHNAYMKQNAKTHAMHDSFMKNVHALDAKRLDLMRKLQSFNVYRTFKRNGNKNPAEKQYTDYLINYLVFG